MSCLGSLESLWRVRNLSAALHHICITYLPWQQMNHLLEVHVPLDNDSF